MTADKPLGHDYHNGECCDFDYCHQLKGLDYCGKPKADHEPAMVPADELAEAKQRIDFAEAEVTRWRNQAVKEAEECKGWKAKAEEAERRACASKALLDSIAYYSKFPETAQASHGLVDHIRSLAGRVDTVKAEARREAISEAVGTVRLYWGSCNELVARLNELVSK